MVASLRSGKEENSSNDGLAGPLLNRRNDLSIRNGVLLYKQLIHSAMDYVCPAWISAACTHVRKLQVLQSVFASLPVPLVAFVTGKFTSIWVFHSRRHQSPDCELRL
jgi:hypothetical protein